MTANKVAGNKDLLRLINDFSGVNVRVKRDGEFHKNMYFSTKYGRIVRELFAKGCWTHIGRFEDYLPYNFVTNGRCNSHLYLYYNLCPKEYFWVDLKICHLIALPCEVCGRSPGEMQIEGRALGKVNYMFQDCTRLVDCCVDCKHIFDNLTQSD